MRSATEPIRRIVYKVTGFLPDKLYLSLRYFLTFKKKLNWEEPETYNEKLQWMKVYDRNPIYTSLVDKAEVKKYVADKLGGSEYIIPTIGVWNNFDDIQFDKLSFPSVLKCTHDSGSIRVCENKENIDIEEMRKHFNQCLKHKSFKAGREWAYKNVSPRIIAEPFLVDISGVGLMDYKFFCFDGKVKALFVATDRGVKGQDVKFDFFDAQFNHLNLKHGHNNAPVIPAKPENFEKMIDIAEKLSVGLRHVRVDLYNINGKILFGEMTFYHHCGFVPFDPEEWDHTFGGWISLE